MEETAIIYKGVKHTLVEDVDKNKSYCDEECSLLAICNRLLEGDTMCWGVLGFPYHHFEIKQEEL